jgi:hypothetical protein
LQKEKAKQVAPYESKSHDYGGERCFLTPSLAYQGGFHDGLQPNKNFMHSRRNVPDFVLSSYEDGFKDGWMYCEDLKSIKDKANSKVDLFLTLLLAFEENLVADDLREYLIEVFHEAVEKYEYEKEFIQDSRHIEDVDFLIGEIEYLIFTADDDEIETSVM